LDRRTDRYEVVTDIAHFLELRSDWNALLEQVPQAYFSQSFDWCRVAWEQIAAPRRRRLHCIVAREGGRAVLIWPFVLSRRALWSFAYPLGSETTEYTSPLVLDDSASDQRIEEGWNILRRSSCADVIFLPYVRADSPAHRILSKQRTALPPALNRSWFVNTKTVDNWEQYVASLKRSHRGDLRRTRRRLSELGMLSFEPAVDQNRCAAAIDWILAQKQEWLVRKSRENPWLRDIEYKNFLIEMAGNSVGGSLIISVLRLDEKIIAAALARIDKVRAECLNTVYDRAYGKYGPGQLLIEECVKWAFEHDLIYDLRIGDEPYKGDWATDTCNTFNFDFANSKWGAGYFIVKSAARQIRSAVPKQAWRPKPGASTRSQASTIPDGG
jgi:CelD/BcsL family acetyltransferase involved in cellulose biosynthesis